MKNDNAELIRRILDGDNPAFTKLVKKYQKQVHALAWRKIGDFHVAEEITQDTFLIVYQKLATLKNPNQFSGWLYVIANRRCIAWLRKKRLETESLENTESELIEGAAYSQYVAEERAKVTVEAQREVVKKLLAKLKESERTVMILHYFGDMTCEEISRFLGVSTSTIKSRLRRARQRLQKEELMIREALSNFQLSPNLTENIMQKISRTNPAAPSGSKPLVPWVLGTSSVILIMLMLGMGSQNLARFQQPYSLESQSEMTVELIDAPIVQNLETKPDIRNQFGKQSDDPAGGNDPGQKPNQVLSDNGDYTQWHLPDGAKTRIGKGSIDHISFSPDGARFAVATSIGVWIYDAQTGKEISLIKVNYRGPHLRDRVAFSPDGKTIATGKWRGSLELWDVETGKKITTLKKHIGGVYDLEFSPDGKMLSCGSLYRGVEYHMWEVDSGREVARFKGEQESYSYSAFVMSPGARLIASTGKGKIFLWDTATHSLRHTIDFPESYAWGLTFSPDNKTLVSSGRNVILWDTETGKQISKLDGQRRTVNPLTYSPDGKILAGGSYSGKIILWDMEQPNHQPKDRKLTLPALLSKVVNKRPSDSKHPTLVEHTHSIETLAFTADSKTLASGSRYGTVIVWDVANRTPQLTVDGHTGSITALRFLENDQTLFSVSSDGIVRIWNTDTGAEKFIKTNWYAYTIAFPQDGKTVAFRGSSNEIQIWDVDNDKLVHTFKTEHKDSINVLAFSPDGKTIASGGHDGTLEVWDVSARQRFATLDSHTDTVNVVLFSPDGKMFASASQDGKVQLWNILTGKKAVLLTEPNKGVSALAFSPDSKTLVSGRLGGPIQVWDTTTHQHLGDFINASGTVDSLTFSPDGKILASGLYNGLIRLWDVNSKTKIQEILSAHNDNVEKFAFTSDSKTLVSGSRDGTLLIWDLDKMGIGNR